ncbi:MAG: competence/damage-inducible protein A, partial [Oscillospiraceae bacterium]|nr:competence/damage-inducible protein A [Oscillospiraceae bacterium]
MRAEIISVGTELLLGDIVNTNAQFISQQLSAMGVSVYNQQVVGDNPDRLRQAAQLAKDRSDIVIYTGGLGP